MVLRYVKAKSADDLSDFMRSLVGVRISVVNGPIFADGYWWLWLTADNPKIKNVELD